VPKLCLTRLNQTASNSIFQVPSKLKDEATTLVCVTGAAGPRVGFELELGLSGSDKGIEFNRTCPECSQIRWVLEAIASWIRDQKDVDLTLELSHREQRISYSAARENRPDAALAIRPPS
jgi:hypothetical protein